MTWEYRTIRIPYSKRDKNWAVEFPDGRRLVGLDTILEAYGNEGWELVSLSPDRFDAFPGFGRWTADPAEYRATFKRPVGA